MSDIITEILREEIPGLEEDALIQFASCWNIEKQFKKDDLLYRKGATETKIYFVVKGLFKICYEIEEQEMIVGFGLQHTFLLDLPSFITQTPSHFHITALKKSTVLGIAKKDFDHFLNQNIIFASYWRKKLEAIILGLVEREIDLLITSPKLRYERLLHRSPYVFQEVPHKYIAAYLRMTPETLSRLQKS